MSPVQYEKSFHEISLLRMSVKQLRQIASSEPEPVAAELLRIADNWDARANVLEAAVTPEKPPIAA
jgi:hypothetical protein